MSCRQQLEVRVIAFIVFLCSAFLAAAQTQRMNDQSDWWALINPTTHREEVKAGNSELHEGTFSIDRLELGKIGINEIRRRWGKATVVERGDASTDRRQLCYVSPTTGEPVYVVFEFGEDVSNFYIFTGSKHWKGERLCVKTAKVSKDVATASGLKLGLSQDAVKAILGQPDATQDAVFMYSREVKRKASAAQIERQRKEYPEHLSEAQAQEKFGSYTAVSYVETKFTGSKLSYLAVSKSTE
jgi:hypothetical protein